MNVDVGGVDCELAGGVILDRLGDEEEDDDEFAIEEATSVGSRQPAHEAKNMKDS